VALITVTRVAGNTTWVVPAGVTSIDVRVIGAGGGGGTRSTNGGGGGGGGGAVSITTGLTVTPGQTVYTSIPAGGAPGATAADCWVNVASNAAPSSTAQGALAKAGVSVGSNTATGGAGGAAGSGIGSTQYSGGAGSVAPSGNGGGGGSSAGSSSAGASATSTSTGATAPADGGNGGNGATTNNSNGFVGGTPGGGGGGGKRSNSGTRTGGGGGPAQVVITYEEPLAAALSWVEVQHSYEPRPAASLVESFAGEQLNGLVWVASESGVVVSDGAVTLTAPAAAGSEAFINTGALARLDLRESEAFVRIVSWASNTEDPYSEAAVYLQGPGSSSNTLSAVFGHDSEGDPSLTLAAYTTELGTTSALVDPFSAGWLRFRQVGGDVQISTAPTAASNPPGPGDWTVVYTRDISADSAAYAAVELIVSAYNESAAGAASIVVDSINTEASSGEPPPRRRVVIFS